MQESYPEAFDREMGCTESEWLSWLPGATGGRPLALEPGRASVGIDGGLLVLRWRVLPPRRIALITLPRLAVEFRFEGIAAAPRAAFMRYFDLYLQRGGG